MEIIIYSQVIDNVNKGVIVEAESEGLPGIKKGNLTPSIFPLKLRASPEFGDFQENQI